MKKYIILWAVCSSLILADSSNDMLEDRVENHIQMNNIIPNYKVDYDVDIYNNQMNIELEFEGMTKPKMDFNQLAEKLVSLSREEAPQVTDIYVVVKYDPLMGDDQILFSKKYIK